MADADRVMPNNQVNRSCLIWLLALTCFCVISCATISQYKFSEPTVNWHTKSGQLMYRTPQSTLIGDVLVRFSNSGDFELTFSKGPGVNLLSLRQDATFAEVKGAFARGGWSGPVQGAPPQLRGWLGLRDKLIHSLATGQEPVLSASRMDRQTLRYVAGNETFLFQF
jgi:hypothetical protein